VTKGEKDVHELEHAGLVHHCQELLLPPWAVSGLVRQATDFLASARAKGYRFPS